MANTSSDVPAPDQESGHSKTESPLPAEQVSASPRNNTPQRHRKNKSKLSQAIDGTVSDSVTNPTVSHHAKRMPKPRQHSSVVPMQSSEMGRATASRARPASVGGPMLPATPSKEQAYAGPTFHASPAASALPVPKFFSRSLSNDASLPHAPAEGQKTPEKQSSPDPAAVQLSVERAQQSPLDLFFKADREERSRSAGMLSPEMAIRKPAPATEPRNKNAHSGKSVFLRELDGNSLDMPSPRAGSEPPQTEPVERPHSSPAFPQHTDSDSDAHNQREVFTKSLKDLLFSNINSQTDTTNTTPPPPQHRAYSDAQPFQTPSPHQRPASGPTTPVASSDQSQYYALHYGNRNLSSLFQAARGDTPPRPSSLRQQLGYDDHRATAVIQSPPSPLPPNPAQTNANRISRDFLDQQIRDYKPASLPQLPYANGSGNGNPRGGVSNSVSPPFPATALVNPSRPSGVGNGVSASGSASREGSRDVRSMEDDLRRMLKLNVLNE